MKQTILLLLSLALTLNLFAAKVDTVTTFSPSMNKSIKAVVITPDGYDSAKEMPTLYLLHGYSGSYASYVHDQPVCIKLADTYQMLVVCADGGYGSWYWDSPVDPTFKYETYVATELVKWIDERYKTVKSPAGRGICGLSMGGHGALYLALRHQDVFGAAGSMSGGVDTRPFPNNWDMAKRLGKYSEQPETWDKYTAINQLHLYTPKSLAIMIDCGTGDFFYTVNEKLHQKMLELNIPHDYISRPGKHNGEYWNTALPYQMLFMSSFFEKGEKTN